MELAFEYSVTAFEQAFMGLRLKKAGSESEHVNNTRAARIIEQNRGAIAWVGDLAGEAVHAPVETLLFDGKSFQQSVPA